MARTRRSSREPFVPAAQSEEGLALAARGNSVDATPERVSARMAARRDAAAHVAARDAEALVSAAMAAVGATREMLDAEQTAAKQAAIQQYLAEKKAVTADAPPAGIEQRRQVHGEVMDELLDERRQLEAAVRALAAAEASQETPTLVDDNLRRPFLQDATIHSSERRLPGAVPATPESPMPGVAARGTPGRSAPAWSGRGGWGIPPPGVGLLGYPTELLRFRRSTASLSPVQSEGSNEGGSRGGTPPLLTLPATERRRRQSKEVLDRAGRILPTTPEQSAATFVSATPPQVSVMMSDRLSRQQPPEPSTAADAEAERERSKELAAAAASGGERQLAVLLAERSRALWSSGSNGSAAPSGQGLSRRPASRVDLPPATQQRGGDPTRRGGGGGGAVGLQSKPAAARGGGGGAAPWACFVEGVHRLLGCRV